jgi:hypothetical protein
MNVPKLSLKPTTIFPSGKAMTPVLAWLVISSVAFTNDTRDPKPDRREPQAWHENMTCHKCLKVGKIATFCENEKVSHKNVQDGETQVTNEDAVLELIVAEQEWAN